MQRAVGYGGNPPSPPLPITPSLLRWLFIIIKSLLEIFTIQRNFPASILLFAAKADLHIFFLFVIYFDKAIQ